MALHVSCEHSNARVLYLYHYGILTCSVVEDKIFMSSREMSLQEFRARCHTLTSYIRLSMFVLGTYKTFTQVEIHFILENTYLVIKNLRNAYGKNINGRQKDESLNVCF